MTDRDPLLPQEPFSWARFISASICALYVAAAYLFIDGEAALRMLAFCALPLACIWFPDSVGSATDNSEITKATPGGCVFMVGWLLLLLPPVVAAIIAWSSR